MFNEVVLERGFKIACLVSCFGMVIFTFSASGDDKKDVATPKINVKMLAATPVVKIGECAVPPSIDGRLDDECWKNAYESPCFYDFKLKSTKYPPNKETTLHLAADKRYLYVGVKCVHPYPKDMSVEHKENFSRIFGDECVKFFINPGLKDNRFFRFVVNPYNAHTFTNSFVIPDVPWPSATKHTAYGWNLEVAIPLFYLASHGDIKKIRMNVFRKKMLKVYDNQHVQVGKTSEISTWCPTDVWVVPEKMGRIEGLGAKGLTVPFLVTADSVKIHRFRYAGKKVFYDVAMELKNMTNTSGKVIVVIDETTFSGKRNSITKKYPLKGKKIEKIKIEIPVVEIGKREIKVELRNAAGNMLLQAFAVNDTSVLEMMNAFAKLNYYTSEKTAKIVYSLGLPKKELQGKNLRLLDERKALVASAVVSDSKGYFSFPVEKLHMGVNHLKFSLSDVSLKDLFSLNVDMTRLAPNPNGEVKIDREYGFFIKNGKPFFPYGFCAQSYDHALKEISDAGFNTVVYWFGGSSDMRRVVEKFAKYNLNAIIRPHCLKKYHPEKLNAFKKYIDPKDYKKAAVEARAPIRIKLMNVGAFSKLTRAQRNEFGAEYFDYHMPEIIKNVDAVKNHSNLFGYNTLDEPIFIFWDLHKELRKLYLAEKKADPYHPVFVLYSSRIPQTPYATNCADCLGTDPYWTPGRLAQRGTVDWISMITARTVKRARQDHLVPWTVPEASWWSNCTKRALTGKEQICQSYLTIIHGSKCVLYWVYSLVAHDEQWRALRKLAKQYKVLGPAIAAPDLPQKQIYSSGISDPVKGKLPEIQVRLLKFPSGSYVLLAANSKYYPVDVKITIGGFKDSTVRRLFSYKTYAVKGGSFSDNFEGMGVRAYSIKETTQTPVEISIDMIPHKNGWKPESALSPRGRVGMKNIKPNPSFEDATLPNWPDYIFPARRPRKKGYPRIGTSEATFTMSAKNPYQGKNCLFVDKRNFYFKFASRSSFPQHYALSFYARSESAEPVKIIAYTLNVTPRKYMNFSIAGNEWKRYSASFQFPAKSSAILYFIVKGGPVFLDAMQLEKGLKPTEFQP